MACKRCYGHLQDTDDRMMSLETAQKATSRFFQFRKKNAALSYIMLFGGEPLLNWDLIQAYLPWVSENYPHEKFRLFLFTNGLLLNNAILETLARFNVLVFISLDGDYAQQTQTRPMTREQYHLLIDISKKYLAKHPHGMIPYTVIKKQDLKNFETIIDPIVAHGFKVIALSKEIGDILSFKENLAIFKHIIRYRLKQGIFILPYPEVVCNCHNCAPRNAMVYPDGNVFDLCYVSGAVLLKKKAIAKDALAAFRMGHIDADEPFALDRVRKRKILSAHGTCPLVGEWISGLHPVYHLIGRDILPFYWPVLNKI